MIGTTSSTAVRIVRRVATTSNAFQPSIVFRCSTCPYSTTTTISRRLLPAILAGNSSSPTQAHRIIPFQQHPPTPSITSQLPSTRRHASSTQQSPHDQDATAAIRAAAALNTTTTTASSTTTSSEPPLDWNTFFKLRKTRRRLQLAFSAVTGITGGVGGALLLSTGNVEWAISQVPLDPFMTLGLVTLACVGMGWLVGPIFGSQVFYAMNSRFKGQMIVKEGQFFARIKKNRVDPSNSSAGNPVPDFYGEKVSSVAGYRQWLKDQRAYTRKRTLHM